MLDSITIKDKIREFRYTNIELENSPEVSQTLFTDVGKTPKIRTCSVGRKLIIFLNFRFDCECIIAPKKKKK